MDSDSTQWVVLSVGGSLLNDGKPNLEMGRMLAEALKGTGLRLGIVCGGGKQARRAAERARKKTGSEFLADEAGIKITRKNAKMMLGALGGEAAGAGKKIFVDFAKARKAAATQKFVVMGGTIPGITTDADAALLAECLGAKRMVNLSNSAVYDSDPKGNPNAKKYDTLTHAQLRELAAESDKRMAGTHFIFDLLACSIIARSKIQTHFVDGRQIGQVTAAVEGKPHTGTVVG